MYKLSRKKTILSYRGSEVNYRSEALCTESVMRRCQQNMPFLRRLKLEAMSPDTAIRVELSWAHCRQSISKCPYKLADLVGDQGLDCMFGHRDRRAAPEHKESRGSSSEARMELERLVSVLQNLSIV